VVPIENASFVSRLKTFAPKNAAKGTKIDEVHETLTVSARRGISISPRPERVSRRSAACQAQATVQPRADFA